MVYLSAADWSPSLCVAPSPAFPSLLSPASLSLLCLPQGDDRPHGYAPPPARAGGVGGEGEGGDVRCVDVR